jgi:hypothetical protein
LEHNEPGTYNHSSVSGQAFTVRSEAEEEGDVPTEIQTASKAGTEVMELFSQGPGAKKFKIFVVPDDVNGFNDYCFQLIGQGASFCTSINCTTSHHHASVKAVKPGEIYLAKGISTAFVLPSLEKSVLDPEAVSKWKSLSLTLPDWNKKFFIATSASDELPASTAAIERQEEFFRTKALTFKTPAKHRFEKEDKEHAFHGTRRSSLLSLF